MELTTEVRDDYLYVRVTGSYTLDAARDACRRWSQTPESRAHRCVLCDVTALARFDMTDVPVMQRFDLGRALVERLSPDIRLAILETTAQFDPERFDETVMTNRGVMVHITTSLDEALRWLATWRTPQPASVTEPV